MNLTQWIDDHRARWIELSDQIWRLAELRYAEVQSCARLADTLENAGFSVTRNLAGIPTAFVARYGTGGPVVALLGEYDALPGLSQDRVPFKRPFTANENGHGCGHNLLGVGSLAAALAVQQAIEAGDVRGIVHYYGCPAEESGAGKTFMVKDGAFDGADLALTWHPDALTGVMEANLLARYMVYFSFHGRSAHAAFDPYNGRSALDAVELMNVGVNYLREHIIPEARIHYVILKGGEAPNIVPAEAVVWYQIRAPELHQVREVYDRVVDVARGAALMTGTQVEIEFHSAVSNLVLNDTIAGVLHGKLKEMGGCAFGEEEQRWAREIQKTFTPNIEVLARRLEIEGQAAAALLSQSALYQGVLPRSGRKPVLPGSSDVGDVSWIIPTGQMVSACYALGTPEHSWQIVAQSGMAIGHQGMLCAAKCMALAAVEFMGCPELVLQAKAEFEARTRHQLYVSPIPDGVQPPIGR